MENNHKSSEDLHAKLYPYAAKKQEYITCAAIHYQDGKVYEHQPKNITSGFVATGHRHHNVIALVHQLTGKSAAGEIQGFLTSKNRFVGREEGYMIALEADQIDYCTNRSTLFSEDIY